MAAVSTFIRDVLYFIKNDLASNITDPNSTERRNPDSQWRCNDTSGNNMTDYFGNNTGQSINPLSTMTVSGKLDKALQFEKTSFDQVQVLDSATTNSTTLTIALWFKFTDDGSGDNINLFSKVEPLSQDGFGMYIQGLDLYLNTDGDITQVKTGLSENNWYHLVLSIDSTNYITRVYVDNVLEFSDDGNLFFTAPNYFMSFGVLSDVTLDDIRFYNGAIITEAERNMIYNNGDGTEAVNTSRFVMTSYPQREVKYPIITLKITNQEASRAGMQTTAMDVTITLEVRIWARNEKEKDTLFTDVYDRLRSIQFTTDGSTDNDLHDFQLLSATEVDEAGQRGIKSRIGVFQYRFFNVN